MLVHEVIRAAKEERGITTAELSRRSHINYDNVRRSLRGTRRLNPEEVVLLCKTLGLGMDDFDQVEYAAAKQA